MAANKEDNRSRVNKLRESFVIVYSISCVNNSLLCEMRLEPLRYLEVEREEEEQNESSDSTFNFEHFTVNESQSFSSRNFTLSRPYNHVPFKLSFSIKRSSC